MVTNAESPEEQAEILGRMMDLYYERDDYEQTRPLCPARAQFVFCRRIGARSDHPTQRAGVLRFGGRSVAFGAEG